MLVIKPTISLLLAAATTTVSAGPLFKASPLTISLDHHHNNSSPQAAAAAAAVSSLPPQKQQQKVIETLTAKDGRLVTITYTPAETTPTSTLVRASSSSPWPSVQHASAGPRETSLSQSPSAAAMVVGLRVDTADSGDDDDGATFATASSSSDESSSSDSSSSEESAAAAKTTTTAAKAATTTPAPPKHNPAVASALAQQGYSQETYYECKTYAATSTHCGWHVPVIYVGDGGARAGGSGERAGRMAVGAAAACGLVVNYVLG